MKTNSRGDYHNLNFTNAAYGYLEMEFALETYRLGDIDYTKLMSARWAQILERKDECLF